MIAEALATLVRVTTTPTVRWAGCRPDHHQRIYVANHTSHLDFLVLWSSLPVEVRRHTRPVAASDYWCSRFRRHLARLFDAVLIERNVAGSHEAVKAMTGALAGGDSLILFPEGTRGPEGSVARFRGGLYTLARLRPDLELVPVLLQNVGRVLPKGAWLPVPLIVSVTFGPPLYLNGDESKAAFLERIRTAVIQLEE